MAFPVATGVTTPPIYPVGSSGNGLSGTGFIPAIWSGKLIEKFYNATVLTAISNTDYAGEIRNQGDVIKIRTKPTITIKDYRADGLLELERPQGNVVELTIDKGKYFSLILDDVMEVQTDLNVMNMWSDDAAQQFKIKIDTDVLLGMLGQMHAKNKGTTAGMISSSINLGVTTTPLALVATDPGVGEVDVLDAILRLGQVLDEQNVPETGRWVVMPTWAASLIKRSELRQAYLSGDSVSMLRNGRIGMIDRFTLYTSNLLPGHAHGLTFASQIAKVETIRSEMTFGNILRGLQVYGYKVLDGTAVAQAIVTPA
jgi:hypothetical protein